MVLQHIEVSILKVTKDVFPVWDIKKNIAKLENNVADVTKSFFQLFSVEDWWVKFTSLWLFESLTCLTFTVLSAEALLYPRLMASRLHLGWSTSVWLSENSPLKLETVTDFCWDLFVCLTWYKRSRFKPFLQPLPSRLRLYLGPRQLFSALHFGFKTY